MVQTTSADAESNRAARTFNAAIPGTVQSKVNAGKCLDVPSYSTANGVELQIWTCNGSQPAPDPRLIRIGTGH